LAWDASVVAGPALRVETDRVIARPGQTVNIAVERQSVAAEPIGPLEIGGELRCGDERQALRLWPGARRGAFAGAFRHDREGACIIAVDIDGFASTTPMTFRDDIDDVTSRVERLDAVAAAHGALVVTADTEDELLGRASVQAGASFEAPYHPMRSPFWLIPFVACLGGEWWLRRKAGLS
jgi:hypothetical protein